VCVLSLKRLFQRQRLFAVHTLIPYATPANLERQLPPPGTCPSRFSILKTRIVLSIARPSSEALHKEDEMAAPIASKVNSLSNSHEFCSRRMRQFELSASQSPHKAQVLISIIAESVRASRYEEFAHC
jgi:hypothetical protein